MNKIDPTIKRETAYIAAVTVGLSVLMQTVFFLMNKWTLSVLFGNLLGIAAAVGNFFLMGLTVQRALSEDKKKATRRIRTHRILHTVSRQALEVHLRQ